MDGTALYFYFKFESNDKLVLKKNDPEQSLIFCDYLNGIIFDQLKKKSSILHVLTCLRVHVKNTKHSLVFLNSNGYKYKL